MATGEVKRRADAESNVTKQAALKQVLEPIFERDFSDNSCGFRPGRGAKDAIERVEENLLWGSRWTVDIDIKGYFYNIPQERPCPNRRSHALAPTFHSTL